MRCFCLVLPLLLVAAPGPATARTDGIASKGALSDADFFRLATCGARPGGPCQDTAARWTKPELTVALTDIAPTFPPAKAAAVSAALDLALAEINRAGSGLRLIRDDANSSPDIKVMLAGQREGEPASGIDRIDDGEIIGAGYMMVHWDADRSISAAAIAIASDIPDGDIRSIVLEELFQSLGFPFDIENPYYDGKSILAQDSNTTTAITGQDRAILLRMYPGH